MTDPAKKRERIAALRARHEALRAEGQALGEFDARIAAAARMPRDIPPAALQLDTIIPAGWYWQGRVTAGSCLRLDNPRGTPGLSCLIWNAADPSERFCATDTVKVQWTALIGRGRLLLSDMGRVLASIVEDTCGRHDVLLGAGPPRGEYDASSPLEARNGAENLSLGTGKLGLGARDLHAPAIFFAPVRCGPDQRFGWAGGATLRETYVDLHAEMDLLAVVSNVPHPLAPAGSVAEDAGIRLWRPQRADISRFCRDATSEAGRAFAATRAYLSGSTGRRNGQAS
ncbi:MAG: DUF1989 domain-containing protein [Geminicoccales bacterium]